MDQRNLSRFAVFAWIVLGINVLVILWGAFVRASGSGAGCGSHWPLCNGQVLPSNPQIETLIEFTHRVMSGLALILILVMLIWAFRAFSKGDPVRLGAVLSAIFILTEALVGASLVIFEWVANDASLGRVISQGVHLTNTFLLLASLTLTAWWASGGNRISLHGQGMLFTAVIIGAAGVFLIGVTGAITALGDTLFPAASLAAGVQQDFSPTANFLIRLRVWHPVAAITAGFYLIFFSLLVRMFRPTEAVKRLVILLIGTIILQFTAGLINLVLLAPTWMQIIHLLLADMTWILFVLLAAAALSGQDETETMRIDQANRPSPAPLNT